MKIKLLAILTMVILAITLLNDSKTFAYPPFLKETKALGFEAKDCTYCHQKNAGGKGWNKRGLWLKDQKKERKAPVIDVRWLKFYREDAVKEEVKNEKTSNNTSN